MQTNNSSYPWMVLYILFLNLFLSFITMYAMPPLFSEIMQEIALSEMQMGIIMGVATVSAIFCTPLAGGLSDRFGCRWVAGWGAVIGSLGGALRLFAESALLLAFCMFFWMPALPH